MHIKEKVTGLWARRPRLSGTQGRALKGVAQFFAAMLVCTLIARGTAGATLAVVQTASPRRGELVQGLTADAALYAAKEAGRNCTRIYMQDMGVTMPLFETKEM